MRVRISAYSHFPQWKIGLVPFLIPLQDEMGWEWELRVGSDTLTNTFIHLQIVAAFHLVCGLSTKVSKDNSRERRRKGGDKAGIP